jgi:hypothetical protein
MKLLSLSIVVCIGTIVSGCTASRPEAVLGLAVEADRSITLIAAKYGKQMKTCLKSEGFDYKEVPTSLLPQQTMFYRWPLTNNDLDSIRQDGFGLVTLYKNAKVIEQDENRRYFDALSASGRAAYSAAQEKCTKKWSKQAGEGEAPRASARFRNLTQKIELTQDFRVLSARWSACVKKRGYSASKWSDLEQIILELSDATGTNEHSIDPSIELAVAKVATNCWEPLVTDYAALFADQ